MAFIRIRTDIAQVINEFAKGYAIGNNEPADEMGAATIIAGMALLSTGMNDVQMQEFCTHVLAHVFELTAPLRKPNAS